MWLLRLIEEITLTAQVIVGFVVYYGLLVALVMLCFVPLIWLGDAVGMGWVLLGIVGALVVGAIYNHRHPEKK